MAELNSNLAVAVESFLRYQQSRDRDEQAADDADEAFRILFEEVQNEELIALSTYELLSDYQLERLLRDGHKRFADKAEEIVRQAFCQHGQRPNLVQKFATILLIRYNRLGEVTYLEEVLLILEDAIAAVPLEDKVLPLLLETCAEGLLALADHFNDPERIEMSLELICAALSMQGLSPTQTLCLKLRMADALCLRFRVFGRSVDLEKALEFVRESAEPQTSVKREILRLGLLRSKVLEAAFDSSLDTQTLRQLNAFLVQLGETITDLNRNPLVPEILQSTGRCINKRFFSPGQRQPQAYNMIKSGLEMARDVHASWQVDDSGYIFGLSRYYFELSQAQLLLYTGYWTPEVLEQAVMTVGKAFRCTSPGSAYFGLALAEFSHILRTFKNICRRGNYDEYVSSLLQGAMESTFSGMRFSMLLRAKARLACEFARHAREKWEENGNMYYLDCSIRHFAKAIDYANIYPELRIHLLTSIIEVLLAKIKITKGRQDLKLGEFYFAQIQDLVKSKKASYVDGDFTKADLSSARFEILGDRRAGREALAVLRNYYLNPTGSLQNRLMAALHAGTLHQKVYPNSAQAAVTMAEVVDVAIENISNADQRQEILFKTRMLSPLVPSAAILGLRNQYTLPVVIKRISNTSPLLAVWMPRIEYFIRQLLNHIRSWLMPWISTRKFLSLEETIVNFEKARTIIWNRRLGRQTDDTALRSQYPTLAAELQEVLTDLNRIDRMSRPIRETVSFTDEVRDNRFETSDRYHSILTSIRRKPGFETFGESVIGSNNLKGLASEGPIVMFIHNKDCYVVLISKSHVDFLDLPGFEEHECARQHAKMVSALKSMKQSPESARRQLDEVLIWLWNVAAAPIIKRLGFMKINSTTHKLPHIWWVTSGWINLLPIHAAGDHNRANETGEKCSVLDYMISSYIPSLSVLQHVRATTRRMKSQSPPKQDRPSALLAAMEVTPDIKDNLPNAPREISEVSSILESEFDITEFSTNPKPLRKTIVTHLCKCTFAHVALHGKANDEQPLRSIIYLEDWKTKPLNIAFLMRMNIKNCQLIYLSGCEMAVNKDVLLKDEGLHIAGALQMAGIPNTIASWWQIVDLVAVDVAKLFYEGLRTNGDMDEGFDVTRSAASLRNAQVELRRQGHSSFVWAPFVHFGV